MFKKWKEKRELKKRQEEAARRAREAAEIAASNELAKTIVNDRYQEILKQYSYVQESWLRHDKIVELEFVRYSYRSSELYVRVNPYDGRGGYREFSYSGSMGAIMSAIEKELSKKNSQLHISSEGPVTKKEERISQVVDGDDFVTWYEEHGKIIIKVLPKERPNVMGPQVMPYFPPFTPTSSSSTSSQNTNNPTKNTNTSSQNSSASSQSVYPSSERQEKINKMFAGRYDIKHTLKKLQKMNEILEKQNIMTASEQTSAPASPKPVAQTPEKTYSTGLWYKINDDGSSCTIVDIGACADTDLNIPPEIDGYKVTAIGNEAFSPRTFLHSVTIPDSVTTIGHSAFDGCTGLTSVTFKDARCWCVFQTEGASSRAPVVVTNSAKAAKDLVITYCKYYWCKEKISPNNPFTW